MPLDLGHLGTVSGKLIGLTINGEFVSCETSCSFNFDVEMINTSPIDNGRWREVIPGVRSWSMSVDGNLLLRTVGADIKTVLNAVLTGEEVNLEFRTKGTISPSLVISGRAIPASGGISAPRTKATWNIEFVGNGAFEVDVEEFWLLINNMPIDNDYQTIVDLDY